jgi:hypothetical protein
MAGGQGQIEDAATRFGTIDLDCNNDEVQYPISAKYLLE